jgi:hypothetical protein
MLKCVYIVTSGSYSDYRIRGVFSSEKKAQRYNREILGDIEQWDINIPNAQYEAVRVAMTSDGSIITHAISGLYAYPVPRFLCTVHGPALIWEVYTSDRERAIKIVNEKRAQILAANAWGDQKYLDQLAGQEGDSE